MRRPPGLTRTAPPLPDTTRFRSFCVDRRGVWLAVADGARGVHVNGREVRRMAMLRVGDAVYVDGVEMRVIGSTAPELPGAALHEPTSNGTGDPRVVLRDRKSTTSELQSLMRISYAVFCLKK